MSSRKCPRTLAVLVLCTVVADAGSPSGVYTDNGVQTIRQDHQLSAEEWTEIEREMLAAFGVPNKSRRARRNLDGSASQFLFDIYRSIERDGPPHGREPRSVSDVGRLYDDHVVQDSDVIVTLYLSNYREYFSFVRFRLRSPHEIGEPSAYFVRNLFSTIAGG